MAPKKSVVTTRRVTRAATRTTAGSSNGRPADLTSTSAASSSKVKSATVRSRIGKKSEHRSRKASSMEVADFMATAERQERRRTETADEDDEETASSDDEREGNRRTLLTREGRESDESLPVTRGKVADQKATGRESSRTRLAHPRGRKISTADGASDMEDDEIAILDRSTSASRHMAPGGGASRYRAPAAGERQPSETRYGPAADDRGGRPATQEATRGCQRSAKQDGPVDVSLPSELCNRLPAGVRGSQPSAKRHRPADAEGRQPCVDKQTDARRCHEHSSDLRRGSDFATSCFRGSLRPFGMSTFDTTDEVGCNKESASRVMRPNISQRRRMETVAGVHHRLIAYARMRTMRCEIIMEEKCVDRDPWTTPSQFHDSMALVSWNFLSSASCR